MNLGTNLSASVASRMSSRTVETPFGMALGTVVKVPVRDADAPEVFVTGKLSDGGDAVTELRLAGSKPQITSRFWTISIPNCSDLRRPQTGPRRGASGGMALAMQIMSDASFSAPLPDWRTSATLQTFPAADTYPSDMPELASGAERLSMS